jgi:hypothetical protein
MWRITQKIKTKRITYLNPSDFSEEVEEPLSTYFPFFFSLSSTLQNSLPITFSFHCNRSPDDKDPPWTITDHAPAVFWNIRDLFGVDQQQYMVDLVMNCLNFSIILI